MNKGIFIYHYILKKRIFLKSRRVVITLKFVDKKISEAFGEHLTIDMKITSSLMMVAAAASFKII